MSSNMRDLMNRRGQRAAAQTDARRLRQQAAERETTAQDTAVWLPIEDITEHAEVQVRVDGVDPERVSQYALAMAEGAEFPPIIVFRGGNFLYVADGFHRLAAARRVPLPQISAEVRPGGLNAAIEFAEEANLEHGLSLSSKDKRQIFERRFNRNHWWFSKRRGLSNRKLAAALGVDEKTIRNWLKELQGESAENSAPPPPEVRMDSDQKDPVGTFENSPSAESPHQVDLVPEAVQEYSEADWLNLAAENLNQAANILADLGYGDHADIIMQVIRQLPGANND